MVHNMLGNTEEAMKWWKECLKRNPKRPDVYRAMAEVMQRSGDYQKAAELSRKALELAPEWPDAHHQLAQALLGLGQHEEAIASLEEELELRPGAGEAYCLMGKIYLQLNEVDKANQSYSKSVELQPDVPEAYYGLAMACARLGQREAAREHMARFKQLEQADRADHMERRRTETDVAWLRRVVARTCLLAGRVYRRRGGRLGQLPNVAPAIFGTTTNTRRNRLYDNIVFDRGTTTEYAGHSGVLDLIHEFQLTEQAALEVSDHFPVWAEFSVYESGAVPGVAARPEGVVR